MRISASHPIIDEGWFMGVVEDVSVAYMDAQVTTASYARYVSTMSADIDATPANNRRGVLYEAPNIGALSAAQRKALAQVLEQRREKLSRITAGYALVTPSAAVRGMLTAIFWLAPPPYEHKVSATPRDAFSWLAERVPGLDPARAERGYEALRGRCLEEMKRGAGRR